MIITRSPLRVTLGGGGTDLPSYYREHGGFLVAAAIDKYVYITLHETFQAEYLIKYSKLERVADVEHIEHPIVREAIKLVHGKRGEAHLELTSMADIPAGTGLGSSGSFTTALLKALHAYGKSFVPRRRSSRSRPAISRSTCWASRSASRTSTSPPMAASPASASILPAASTPSRCKISDETRFNLEDNLLLFFTGYSRSAGSILKDQNAGRRSSTRR